MINLLLVAGLSLYFIFIIKNIKDSLPSRNYDELNDDQRQSPYNNLAMLEDVGQNADMYIANQEGNAQT